MNDPTILFVKPKAIGAKDKKALQSAGVIVVEVEDVNNVKLIRAHAELSGGELLACAATAMLKAGTFSSFGEQVLRAVLAKKERNEPHP